VRRFRLNRVTWREQAGLLSGLLAVVALFLPWTGLTTKNPEVAAALASLPEGEVLRNAWSSGFLAWSPPVLLFLAGAAVVCLGQVPSVRRAGLPHLWLIAAVVALALQVLGWAAMDWQFGEQSRALFAEGGITVGAGLGRHLGMVAAVVSVVAAVLDVRAFRAAPARAVSPGRRRGRPRAGR
jgi:hypothetical protein